MKGNIVMLGTGRKTRGGISSVVNLYFNSDLVHKYNVIYISTHVDGSNFAKFIMFVKALYCFSICILSHKVYIVHIHCASRASFYRKSVFIILSKLYNKKTILHIHGGEFKLFYYKESGFLKELFIRKILNIADIIIALSVKWKDDLGNIIGVKENIRVIYNPVKLPDYSKKYNDLEVVRVLLMGRLEKMKGVYDLIKVAKNIDSNSKRVLFILCGDGEVEKTRKLVIEEDCSQHFEIAGWVDNKDKYFKEADIYVLPSYNEGLPMSILEAASYGLPIVSTPVGGIIEIIENGVNGFLINPGDTEALKEKIILLVNSVDLRRRMGIEALRKIKEKFELSKIIKQLDSVYREIIN